MAMDGDGEGAIGHMKRQAESTPIEFGGSLSANL